MDDLKRLLIYVRPYWLIFVFAVIAMFLGALFETATGALLVPIFNQFLPVAGIKSKTLFDLSSLIPRDDWFKAWMGTFGGVYGAKGHRRVFLRIPDGQDRSICRFSTKKSVIRALTRSIN
jgi:ABC-type multidrug transport system fused ATPase/permease subunit